MNNHYKKLAIAGCLFISGLVIGIVCGAALHEILRPSITIESRECPDCKAECEKLMKPPVNFNEGDTWGALGGKPLLYGPPAAYLPDGSDKLELSLSKEFLPAYMNDSNGKKFSLSELTASYNLVVFGTPGCPYCFSNLEYLRKLRKQYNQEQLGIVVVNIAMRDKEQAKMERDGLTQMLNSKDEKFQTAYKTTDADDFVHALIPADNINEWGQGLSLYSTPLLLLFDSEGRLLLRSEGYYDENSKDKTEMERRTAIINKYVGAGGN